MSYLYVNESGSTISLEAGYFVVKNQEGDIKKIPKETLESVGLFGNIHLTTPCVKECLERKIPVCYFSNSGYYFGKLESARNTNIFRLKKQIHASENKEFTLGFTKKIISAKIQNQHVLLHRYNRTVGADVSEEETALKIAYGKIAVCQTIEQVLGHEGIAARNYFHGLAKLIDPEFAFDGRNRMPPRDPFNAMISFGYTVLMQEIFGELENHGLTPYGGFMHQDRERHPTLASDLLEEWRAVIVDATVLSLIQGHEVSLGDFEKEEENCGIIMKKDTKKRFLHKLEMKMQSEMNYLSYISSKTSFRKAIWLQVGELVKAIETGDYNKYEPIRIR